MALTTANFNSIKATNPSLNLGLFPDTNGVANNRVIVYGLASNTTGSLMINTVCDLTGVQWQRANYLRMRKGARMFYSNISVTQTGGSKPTYRYLKVLGYGSGVAGQLTYTRMIEVEAWSGGVNQLAGKTATSYSAIALGSTNIATLTDGVKTTTANSYPIWSAGVPNANVVFDLGSQKALDSLAYYSYSINGDQRVNKFKIQGSNDNTNWTDIWDMSTTAILQPILANGYTQTY